MSAPEFRARRIATLDFTQHNAPPLTILEGEYGEATTMYIAASLERGAELASRQGSYLNVHRHKSGLYEVEAGEDILPRVLVGLAYAAFTGVASETRVRTHESSSEPLRHRYQTLLGMQAARELRKRPPLQAAAGDIAGNAANALRQHNVQYRKLP